MSWFIIRDAAGADVRRVFILSPDDLAPNVPAGCTAEPDEPVPSPLPKNEQ